MKKLSILLVTLISLYLFSVNTAAWVYEEDFSSDPFSNGWETNDINNPRRYAWDSVNEVLHTENYTNSGEWAVKPINYNGESFNLSFDIKPTDRTTGDVTFGLLGENKITNSTNLEERLFVLVGGYYYQIYIQGTDSGQEWISTHPGSNLMEVHEWHHFEIDYDATLKRINLQVTRDNGTELVLDKSINVTYGFSNNIKYIGVSMVGEWATSGRYEAADIDNISLVTEGPVGYWKFDGDATDSSGYGNDGTVKGASLCPDRCGNLDSAYCFDGIDDYIDIPDAPELNPTSEVTIAAWFNLETSHSNYWPPLARKGDSSFGYELTCNGGPHSGVVYPGIQFDTVLDVDGFVVTDPATHITLNAWQFAVGVFDGVDVKLYLNGELQETDSAIGNIIPTSHNLMIGGDPNPAIFGRFFNGAIDEVRIYNRALSQEEIQAIMDECLPEPPHPCWTESLSEGLIGYWGMNEENGESLIEEVNGLYNATLLGDVTHKQGLVSNGTGSYGNAGDVATLSDPSAYSFDVTDNFSYSFWARKSTIENDVGFIVKGTSAGRGYYIVENPSGTIRVTFIDTWPSDTFAAYFPNTITSDGSWTHYLVTYDGSAHYSGIKLYVNGEEKSYGSYTYSWGTVSSITNTDALHFGNYLYLGIYNYPMKGDMDEIGVWNRTLSSTEAKQLWNNGNGITYADVCEPPCIDFDDDGYAVEGEDCGEIDCDDNDASINPGATEVCDGVDNNCDSLIDEEGAIGCTVYYYDGDGDQYGTTINKCLCSPEGYYTATQDGDCDDTDPAINPGAEEVCDDGIDNDCDEKKDVSPVIDLIAGPIEPIPLDQSALVSIEFTDLNVDDTHTAIFDWGDNIGATTVNVASGARTVEDTYTYTQAGVYTVTLTVSDGYCEDSSAIYEYIVVYDPNGGFVTGGGWIDSPEGAYPADPTLTGKASFGFVSKYKKGATIPTGETEFQFKVADLNFHSAAYEWLVIAGARAMYKGTGTVNGEGNYGFMLTAIDEKLTPSTDVDMFRIKIWDIDNGDAIVYDNQIGDDDDAELTTGIGGGSIVIHKSN